MGGRINIGVTFGIRDSGFGIRDSGIGDRESAIGYWPIELDVIFQSISTLYFLPSDCSSVAKVSRLSPYQGVSH